MSNLKDSRRVVVTGIGVLASNGNNKDQFYENCVNGVTGIKECTLFDANKLRTPYVGEINKEMPYQPKTSTDKERIQCIMESAIDEMMEDSCLSREYIDEMGERAYLSFASSLAANSRIMGYVYDKKKGKIDGNWLIQIPRFVSYIKEKCGINGGCYTTMSACAAGTTSAGIGYDLINQNKADLVVVGGADPLTEFSCVGFHSLKSLSKSICKPFDEERDGINIGEGGAFFIFETLESAKKRNAKIYGEILGYGINNDAYHMTSPDPNGSGARASINMALSKSNCTVQDIDYVNAHGTGTSLNDSMEAKVIKQIFDKSGKKVCVSSTKSMIGHCLAAAGSLELAATLLSIKNSTCMPTINLTSPMEECSSNNFITTGKKMSIRYAISNSFAFAGNTASILIGDDKHSYRE